jgi:hypothetical protein
MKSGDQGHATVFLKDKGQIGSRAGFDADAQILPGFREKVGFVF